ncbi:MAG: hypothetical protein ACLTSX_14650 [Collinsella sp.]
MPLSVRLRRSPSAAPSRSGTRSSATARAACPSGAAASRATCSAPGGHGWRVPEGARRALVVGRRHRRAPVLCLARELVSRRRIAVDACMGAATAGKLVGVEDFEALGCGEIRVATDDGTARPARFLHRVLSPSCSASSGYDYVATCGPAS